MGSIVKGLASCNGQWNQAYCIMYNLSQLHKLVEALLSSLIIAITFYEIIKGVQSRPSLNFILFVQILMVLSLIFNFFHTIWSINVLLMLEILFGNIFFLTIFYYVGFNILKKRILRYLLHISYSIFVLFQIALAIERIIEDSSSCAQTWYLVVDSIAILISILLFTLYWQQQKQQQRLFFAGDHKPVLQNPFKMMWVMIVGNIFCSLVSLGQSIAFRAAFSSSCQFTDDENTNEIIDFIFVIFSFYVGFLCALISMRDSRKKREENLKIEKSLSSYSNVDSGRGRLELIIRDTENASRTSSID